MSPPSDMSSDPNTYRQQPGPLRQGCAVKAAIDVIRGRWKPSILWELYHGTKRYSEGG